MLVKPAKTRAVQGLAHLSFQRKEPGIRTERVEVGAREGGGTALRDGCQGHGSSQLELAGQRLQHPAARHAPAVSAQQTGRK